MNINNLKIKVKPKYYYGYFQGVTVHINGKKFPTEKTMYMLTIKKTRQSQQL